MGDGTVLLFFEHQKGFNKNAVLEQAHRAGCDHLRLQRDELLPLATNHKLHAGRSLLLDVAQLGHCGTVSFSPSYTFSLVSTQYHVLSFRNVLWNKENFEKDADRFTRSLHLFLESLGALRPMVLVYMLDQEVRHLRSYHVDGLLSFAAFHDDFPRGVIPPKRKELQEQAEHMVRRVTNSVASATFQSHTISFASPEAYSAFVNELRAYFKQRYVASRAVKG